MAQELRLAQAQPAPSVTLSQIVDSVEWQLVEDEMRKALKNLRREFNGLDPMDRASAHKGMMILAKIKAVKALNRQIYEASGLAGVSGETVLDG